MEVFETILEGANGGIPDDVPERISETFPECKIFWMQNKQLLTINNCRNPTCNLFGNTIRNSGIIPELTTEGFLNKPPENIFEGAGINFWSKYGRDFLKLTQKEFQGGSQKNSVKESWNEFLEEEFIRNFRKKNSWRNPSPELLNKPFSLRTWLPLTYILPSHAIVITHKVFMAELSSSWTNNWVPFMFFVHLSGKSTCLWSVDVVKKTVYAHQL